MPVPPLITVIPAAQLPMPSLACPETYMKLLEASNSMDEYPGEMIGTLPTTIPVAGSHTNTLEFGYVLPKR